MLPDDQLIARHLPLVRRIASRYVCHGAVGEDDLVQEGLLGLLQAARSYREDRGAAFATWASLRISGRIRDYLRDLDCLSRAHRAQVQRGETADVQVLSLHTPIGNGDHALGDLVGVSATGLSAVEVRDQVAELLRGLRQRDRELLIGYYLDGLTMAQVGRRLGVSESRVSQALSELLERLQERYARREERA